MVLDIAPLYQLLGRPTVNNAQVESISATFTGKGTGIIRVSWTKPIEWTESIRKEIISHAKVVADTIRMFT